MPKRGLDEFEGESDHLFEVDSADSKGGGNTNPPPFEPSKTVRGYRKFTITAWDLDRLSRLKDFPSLTRSVGGVEVCPDTGRKHLQMYVETKNQTRHSTIKELFGECHIEKAKGDALSNWTYCTKDGEFVSFGDWNGVIPEVILDPLEGKVLRPFQEDVVTRLGKNPDSRTIVWFYDPVGNMGKTVLCKHLALKKGALVVSGSAKDIMCAFAMLKKDKKPMPKIVLWSLPRNTDPEHISYNAMEQVKDGMFFSTKYEPGMVVFNTPHILVFANCMPDMSKLSHDRWEIIDLGPPFQAGTTQE